MTMCLKAANDKRQAQTCDDHHVGATAAAMRKIYATATYAWQDQEARTAAAADGVATAIGLSGSDDDASEDVQAKEGKARTRLQMETPALVTIVLTPAKRAVNTCAPLDNDIECAAMCVL